MTTDRRQPDRGALLRMTPLELRSYLATLLAAVYTIAWRAIGGQAPAAPPPLATPPPASEPQRFVWIDRLPPDLQPAVALPPGWQRAPEPRASAPSTQPATAAHAPSRGVPRVRTRSS